jgi:hypothetical protein
VQLGPPVGDQYWQTHDAEFIFRTSLNYWDRPYVLYYNASAKGQEWFYLLHTQGRTLDSGLNFDVKLPPLSSRELLLWPINGTGVVDTNLAQIPWDNDVIIWSWIFDYVHLNRLEQQFAAVLETFTSAVYQPMPPTMESTVWQRAVINITLAEFSPTRARVITALEGEAYRSNALADDYLIDEAMAPEHLLTAAALGNYYMWYGIYAMLVEYGLGNEDWRTAAGSTDGDLRVLYTAIARASAVAYLTGKEIPTCMSRGASMTIDFSQVIAATRLLGEHSIDGGEPRVVQIDSLYAPVSGALLLGTVVGSLAATQHLTSIQQVVAKPLGTHEPADMLKAATVYRLFGHDVTMVDQATHEQFVPYANVHECIIEPASTHYMSRTRASVYISDSRNREGRNIPLLPAATTLQQGGLAIEYKRPNLSLVEWQQRNVPVRCRLVPLVIPKPVQFLVKAPMVPVPVAIRARTVNVEEPVFQFPRTRAEAMRPVEPRVEARSASTASSINTVHAAQSKPQPRPLDLPTATVHLIGPLATLVSASASPQPSSATLLTHGRVS